MQIVNVSRNKKHILVIPNYSGLSPSIIKAMEDKLNNFGINSIIVTESIGIIEVD